MSNSDLYESTEEGHRGGSLWRFITVCFFTALVVAILGLFFINELFDENRRFAPLDRKESLKALGEKKDLKPASARNQLRIYFTDDGVGLTSVSIPMPQLSAPQERGRKALETLMASPVSENLHSPIPPGVKLRAFYLRQDDNRDKNEAVVDLSRAIKRKPLGAMGAELLCIHAIVNTALANCETADCARILIDGQTVDTLWGYVDISGPLTFSSTMVKE